ncbi:beta-ketoacyl-[acyl-carrier-protein] synthase family protein [Streptomyces megasporus]|uniref:beta-ketoacyl-[acyl-carrier-protein] synthase family protein n=1 Tax=Streptomyces megasporus TaxID=44060 RepID=UPI0004E27F3D|nr:beta-ketoacyl synthase N-terminal-like domain-containing protein [Streptomyces megasporus]
MRPRRDARDVLVTGMGFCLPGGPHAPTVTAEDVWRTASAGISHLDNDGLFHGIVHGAAEVFRERVPEIPRRHLRSYADVHLYGLISLDEACRDAGLDFRAGDLAPAAVLTARAGVDSNYDSYRAWHDADPETIDPADAKSLFVRLVIAGTSSDVGSVQASLCGSTGPSYTVSCGCASSAVLLGSARHLIASGQVDLAVVTGVDRFDTERVLHGDRLRRVAERGGITVRHNDEPPAAPRHDRPMRPYDAEGDCMNYGDGSVTLILESREHAERRGARPHGALLSQVTTRSGLGSAVGIDTSGRGLADAARRCLAETGTELSEVPYINGGAEGDRLFTRIEANAVRELYGERSAEVLVSSQEACFGHSGAPLGNLGAALSLMMMRRGQVCPTANCDRPSPVCTFDPVPGDKPRELEFSRALSFNYQIGGVNSALLLGGDDVL